MLPLVMGGASLFGTGINAWMQYEARKDAKKAHAKSIKQQERVFERQFGEEKRQARVAEELSREKIKLSKEEGAFNRKQTFLNNFLTTLNTSPAAKAQFIQVSRGRR